MSERDERRRDEDSAAASPDQGATPGTIGALDGAAGSLGAVGAPKPDGVMPLEAPNPRSGAD